MQRSGNFTTRKCGWSLVAIAVAAATTVAAAAEATAAPAAKPAPAHARVADRVYTHGVVFTADSHHPAAEAVAIGHGHILYVGSNAGAKAFIGKGTTSIDLHGGFLMPGVVDGHMHPLQAGGTLIKCNLNYESLTVPEFQSRIQACLDKTRDKEPDGWLEVVNWFQESMRPAGTTTSHATLDSLNTQRPILVQSSFGHTVLANTRAMTLSTITASTPDPAGGKIWHDASGAPTGLFEDRAFDALYAHMPPMTPEQTLQAARAALKAMNAQGVTSFLDAWALPEDLAAFSALSKSGELTARGHFAPVIEPKEVAHLDAAVDRVLAFRKQYDEGALRATPSITVRNAKLFLDGVIAAPALTGSVLEPYRQNLGTADHPNWEPGTSRGPDVYFPPQALANVLTLLGRAGIDPHMHADGDGAVHAALDAVVALRQALPGKDIRPAIAHDEIVGPTDLPRFKALDVTPVLSFQWEKPAGDTLGLTNYFGPERMKILEPAGLLDKAGARIAFGSDWPVDALDEWFAFKVGVTRTNAPDAPAEYHGRLGDDPGLAREVVLRAATINAAHELHEDTVTGSITTGKLADLIVLDRNPLTIPAEDIAHVKVLETVVGGRVVYTAEQR